MHLTSTVLIADICSLRADVERLAFSVVWVWFSVFKCSYVTDISKLVKG